MSLQPTTRKPADLLADAAQVASIVSDVAGMLLDAAPSDLGTSLKTSRRDMVTEYDRRVQAELVERLGRRFGGVGFQCEEDVETGDGAAARDVHCTAGTRFVIDPIDGTANFVHRTGCSAVSVGLVDGEEPLLGVVCNPFAGELFVAARGCGATLNGEALPRIPDVELADALVCVGTSLYFPELYQRTLELLARRGRDFNDIRRTGSAACDCCYTAQGRFGLFFEYSLAPWDYAAGSAIARECGAWVGAMDGGPLVYGRRSSVLIGAPRAVEQFLAGERDMPPIVQPDAPARQ